VIELESFSAEELASDDFILSHSNDFEKSEIFSSDVVAVDDSLADTESIRVHPPNKLLETTPRTPRSFRFEFLVFHSLVGRVSASVVIFAFSVFMLVRSFIGIAPYWQSQTPATSATVVSVFTWGVSIFVFLCVAGWNAATIWHTMSP
jgi:magnesium-transporting ATPase (P-type)